MTKETHLHKKVWSLRYIFFRAFSYPVFSRSRTDFFAGLEIRSKPKAPLRRRQAFVRPKPSSKIRQSPKLPKSLARSGRMIWQLCWIKQSCRESRYRFDREDVSLTRPNFTVYWYRNKHFILYRSHHFRLFKKLKIEAETKATLSSVWEKGSG